MSESLKCVPKGGLVLVTGVTGFIASHVALQLLNLGYKVRGTTRSIPKAEYLRDNAYAKYASNFEIIVVKDLEQAGAFDEAVKGVDGIAHIASPISFNGQDPWKDFIDPAVNGTKNLLVAARDYAGPQLRHIVITSSAAAIVDNGLHPPDKDYTYTESDWNTTSTELVESKGKDAPVFDWYRASKTAAERYAWDFYKDLQPTWGLSCIHPVYSFGPIIHYVPDDKSINTSGNCIYEYLSGKRKTCEASYASQCYTDVRDVAETHVKCLTEKGEEAAGERFITCTGNFCWEELVDVLRSNYPARVAEIVVPDMDNVKKHHEGPLSRFSNEKAKSLLGVPFARTLEESVMDCVRSLEFLLPKKE